jgi:hypothetical protein
MAKNGKPITANEVSITTATISVQVMRIDKRQMTLSVFKQLVEEWPLRFYEEPSGKVVDLDDVECELWGRVNYCPSNCKGFLADENHLHVVWRKGQELRRFAPDSFGTSAELWERLLALPQLFIAT